MRLWIAVLLVSGPACSPASPPPTPSPYRRVLAPAPGSSAGVPRAPAELDRGCEVAVRAAVAPLGDGRFELVATAANESDRPIDTVLFHDCPGTAARFDGLPAGYDLGNRCQAGACREGPTARRPFTLSRGGSTVIARVTLDARAGACNPALEPGRYSIGATIALDAVRSCSTSRAVFEHRSPPEPRPPAQRPARVPPAPPREEPCPAMACAYTPCPPGVPPPTGCGAVCGCTGMYPPPSLLAPQPAPR